MNKILTMLVIFNINKSMKLPMNKFFTSIPLNFWSLLKGMWTLDRDGQTLSQLQSDLIKHIWQLHRVAIFSFLHCCLLLFFFFFFLKKNYQIIISKNDQSMKTCKTVFVFPFFLLTVTVCYKDIDFWFSLSLLHIGFKSMLFCGVDMIPIIMHHSTLVLGF
jgi:hypothetical protein